MQKHYPQDQFKFDKEPTKLSTSQIITDLSQQKGEIQSTKFSRLQQYNTDSTSDVKNNPNQEYVVKISEPAEHFHHSKRLKLKDYMHLNNIQKRGRHQTASKNQQKEPLKFKDLQDQKCILSSDEPQISKQSSQKTTFISKSHQKIPEQEEILMIKAQIQEKIDVSIKRLQQLKSYFEKQFIPLQGKSQNFVFLFTIYNKLIEIHKLNEDVGDRIIEYGGSFAQSRQKSSAYVASIDQNRIVEIEQTKRQVKNASKVLQNQEFDRSQQQKQ